MRVYQTNEDRGTFPLEFESYEEMHINPACLRTYGFIVTKQIIVKYATPLTEATEAKARFSVTQGNSSPEKIHSGIVDFLLQPSSIPRDNSDAAVRHLSINRLEAQYFITSSNIDINHRQSRSEYDDGYITRRQSERTIDSESGSTYSPTASSVLHPPASRARIFSAELSSPVQSSGFYEGSSASRIRNGNVRDLTALFESNRYLSSNNTL